MSKSQYIEFYLQHSDNIEMVRDIAVSLIQEMNIEQIYWAYETDVIEFYIKNKDRLQEQA